MNYKHHYEKLIQRAKNRTLPKPFERHHVIPKCLGGSDECSNIVCLTPEEHYIAHQLLVKIYPTNDKLVHAAIMMTVNRSSNKIYGWLRRRFIEIQSESQKGKGNSQHGTLWINNGKEAKKVKSCLDIPEGWYLGRALKKKKLLCKVCNAEVVNRKKAAYCDQHRVYIKPERLAQITKPLAKIEKNGVIKEVKRNQVPSYKTHGWILIE
jgi:hypothetical protein